MKRFTLWCLYQYQRWSAFFRIAQVPGFAYTTCKFHPSCSEYAVLAVEQYGTWHGLIKTISRLARCNPFNTGGIDYP